jgi:hypothetical protein
MDFPAVFFFKKKGRVIVSEVIHRILRYWSYFVVARLFAYLCDIRRFNAHGK